jgi:hypothetical protein
LTTKAFLTNIEAYYNVQYPIGQKALVAKYLDGKDERYLDFLFKIVITSHSSKWGKTPDIAIFDELRSQAVDELERDIQNQDLSRLALEDRSMFLSDEERDTVASMIGGLAKKLAVR